MKRSFITAVFLLNATLSFAADAQLRWLGHAAFQFTTARGKIFLIDPWLSNPRAPKDAAPKRVDAILVTHAHSDHVGEAFDLAKKFSCPLIASYELTEIAKSKGVTTVQPINPHGSARVDDVTITAVPAVHSSSFKDGDHLLYAGAPLGFVLQEDGVPGIYHAGDTGVFSDMALISEMYQPQVALLPIGGVYTMKPAEAAYAARALQVRTVIPMHFGTFPALAGTPEELRRESKRLGLVTQIKELVPGKSELLKNLK